MILSCSIQVLCYESLCFNKIKKSYLKLVNACLEKRGTTNILYIKSIFYMGNNRLTQSLSHFCFDIFITKNYEGPSCHGSFSQNQNRRKKT